MWKPSKRKENIFGGIFGGGGGASTGNAAPGNPSAGPALNSNGTQQNAGGTQPTPVQGNQQQQVQPDPQAAGLESLAKLWAAPADAKKPETNDPYASLSDEAIMKAVSAAKVSGLIPADRLLAAAGGNQDQATALTGILDQVFQTALAMGAKNAIKISQLGLDSGFNNFRQNDLPSFMSEFTAKQGVAAANPMLANPAYKPIYDAMVEGFRVQFPNASKEDIAAHTQTHLKTFAEGLLSGSKQQKQNANPGTGNQPRITKTEDFSAFF